MISEPIATTTGQINGNSSSTPITTARTRQVLFTKRQPSKPIRHPRLAPSSGGLTLQPETSPIMANSRVPQIKVMEPLQGRRSCCGGPSRASTSCRGSWPTTRRYRCGLPASNASSSIKPRRRFGSLADEIAGIDRHMKRVDDDELIYRKIS